MTEVKAGDRLRLLRNNLPHGKIGDVFTVESVENYSNDYLKIKMTSCGCDGLGLAYNHARIWMVNLSEYFQIVETFTDEDAKLAAELPSDAELRAFLGL